MVDGNFAGLDPERVRVDRSVVRMVFDAVLALIVASVGYVVVGLREDIAELRRHDTEFAVALSVMRERMPIDYVRSEQLNGILNRIDASLMRIEGKLDQKVDKSAAPYR